MKKQITLMLLAAAVICSCKKNELQVSDQQANPKLAVQTAGPFTPAALTYNTDQLELNATGYNPRNFQLEDPWQNSSGLTSGLYDSQANIIRYPGGTFGNYWDYKNEQLFTDDNTNTDGFINVDSVGEQSLKDMYTAHNRPHNTVADLQYAAKGPGGTNNKLNVVFQMNMTTPGYEYYHKIHPTWPAQVPGDLTTNSTWKKMLDDRYTRFKNMLTAANTGTNKIDINYIELGNEYYFENNHPYENTTFPSRPNASPVVLGGKIFGIACKYIAAKIKTDFPNAKIAATATCVADDVAGSRLSTWNSSLKNEITNDADITNVTMHMYEAYVEPETSTPDSFQDQIMRWRERVKDHFDDSGASVWLNNRWNPWFTECNGNWDSGSDVVHAEDQKWGRNLADAYLVLLLHDLGAAGAVLQFQFNNQINTTTTPPSLYNRAKALIAYMKASQNATSLAKINFDGTAMEKLHNPNPSQLDDFAAIQGYCFKTSTSIKKIVLINLSNHAIRVNLKDTYAVAATASIHLQSWTNSIVNNIPSLPLAPTITTETIGDFEIPPFSTNYLDRIGL